MADIEQNQPLLTINEGEETTEKSTCIARMQKRKYLSMCVIFSIVAAAVLLPIMFLVIIPDMVQKNVDNTDITISAATILYPSNASFTSAVTMQFSKNPPIKSRVYLHDVTVSWEEDGGGDMIVLKKSNSMPVDTHIHTLNSIGQVKDPIAMSNFGVFAMRSKDFVWHMSGAAKVHTFLEDVEVNVDKHMPISGYNNFNISPIIEQVNVTGGSKVALHTVVAVKMFSEARVEMIFGQDLHFHVNSRGLTIGIGTVPNCNFTIGEFEFTSYVDMGYTNPAEQAELSYVMSEFLMNRDVPLTLDRFFLQNPVNWLVEPLLSINTSSTLPSLDQPMLVQIDLFISLLNFIHVPFTLVLQNNLDATMTVTHIVTTIIYAGKNIAAVDEQNLHIVVPPRSQLLTQKLTSNANLLEVSAILQLIKAGAGPLDCYSTITALVGDFEVTVKYDQMQVPAFVHQGSTNITDQE